MKNRELREIALLVTMAIFNITGLMAQNAGEDKYREVVASRADKIVQTLKLKDSVTYYSVRERIAGHYITLNKVYADRDTLLKIAKTNTTDKALLEAEKKKIEDGTTEQVAKIHQSFVGDLSKQLTDEQVSKVKDGLTYNVLNVTYTAYLDMIPTLTKPQKDQIYTWLLEAREYAMDAESSDKKHAWFGKYKGRINNYLSAQGYDLQAERAAWEKRIAERKEKGN